ncbi:hypothetical protein, partial [Pseudomonas marincola]|uniref:hypothetical protein n=1 Tax=Pseudomonas marincola TaxID=437900 RepID=UPI003001BD25
MQSPDQQTNAKTRTAKTQSQTVQHSPAAMTEAAMRIPSSAFKPEAKSGLPKTGGWIACVAPQSVKAMQSPDHQTNAKPRTAQTQKPIRATQSRRHDGSRDADSILRIQTGTQIRNTEIPED